MIPSWWTRLGATALALTVFAVALQFARFMLWRRAIIAGLAADAVLMPTDRGIIEYGLAGEASGIPVLWLHGNPGGHDQLARTVLARAEVRDGLHSIVVSRPGYLRTPLASGATPIEQARLLAALLDSLHLDKVAVVGLSGGGPAALQFARLFPERTRALVLVSAITKRIGPDPIGRRERLLRTVGLADWGAWRAALRITGMPGVDPADTLSVRAAEALVASIVPRALRREGDENDQRQFDRAEGWPIDGITAPTLLIAGTEDTTVPIAHAAFAKERIPGSRLLLVEGDHGIAYARTREVWGAARTFILEHAR